MAVAALCCFLVSVAAQDSIGWRGEVYTIILAMLVLSLIAP